MAQQEDVPFPPVIVYTGRSLTRDEEQRLRRFSKSIIIKDARSPERLLDEVTLFLHQVESKLPAERQRMLREVRNRDTTLEGRRILIVEDDVRNIFALSQRARAEGREGRDRAQRPRGARCAREDRGRTGAAIDLVLMDIMMPEMDGFTAMREIRKQPRFAEAADHRADREGDARRPGEVPRRRRQRLHRQAAGRREAAVAGPRVDAEDVVNTDGTDAGPRTGSARDFDIELQLFVDAIFLKYHYDFRRTPARR